MDEKIFNVIIAMFDKWSADGTFMDNIDKCYKAASRLYQTDPAFRAAVQKKTLEIQDAHSHYFRQ